MRPLSTRWILLTAGMLVLALGSSSTFAQKGQARQKDGRMRPEVPSREAPRPEVDSGTEVSLAYDRKRVRAGDTVRVTIRIDRGENVGHVPFHLNFDPAVLRFERGEEGSYLRGEDRGTVFLASPASAGSAVVVGLSLLGRQTRANGDGELCTLVFTAVGAGDAKLTFSRASVRDAENRAVPAEFRPTPLVVR